MIPDTRGTGKNKQRVQFLICASKLFSLKHGIEECTELTRYAVFQASEDLLTNCSITLVQSSEMRNQLVYMGWFSY